MTHSEKMLHIRKCEIKAEKNPGKSIRVCAGYYLIYNKWSDEMITVDKRENNSWWLFSNRRAIKTRVASLSPLVFVGFQTWDSGKTYPTMKEAIYAAQETIKAACDCDNGWTTDADAPTCQRCQDKGTLTGYGMNADTPTFCTCKAGTATFERWYIAQCAEAKDELAAALDNERQDMAIEEAEDGDEFVEFGVFSTHDRTERTTEPRALTDEERAERKDVHHAYYKLPPGGIVGRLQASVAPVENKRAHEANKRKQGL